MRIRPGPWWTPSQTSLAAWPGRQGHEQPCQLCCWARPLGQARVPGVTSVLGNEGRDPSPPTCWVIPAGLLPEGEPTEAPGQSGPRQPACPPHLLCPPHLPALLALQHSLPREELTPGCLMLDAFAGESWGPPGAGTGWSRGLAVGPQPHPDSGWILPWLLVILSPTESCCSCFGVFPSGLLTTYACAYIKEEKPLLRYS